MHQIDFCVFGAMTLTSEMSSGPRSLGDSEDVRGRGVLVMGLRHGQTATDRQCLASDKHRPITCKEGHCSTNVVRLA